MTSPTPPTTESGIPDIDAELARCHARLEIDHAYRLEGGELVRFEIPMDERGSFPDGIDGRDCTIAEMDRRIARLEHFLSHFTSLARVNPAANHALDTAKREWAKRGEG